MNEDNKIKQLEQIMQLMKLYRVDHVEIEGFKVNKLHHDFPHTDDKQELNDDEALFYSAE